MKARDLIDCWESIQARRIILEVLENDPLCDEAHYLMGLMYEKCVGKSDLALSCYQTACRINDNNSEASWRLMRLLNRSGCSDQALTLYSKIRKLKTVYRHPLLLEYIIACEQMERLTEAFQAAESMRMECANDTLLGKLEALRERLLQKLDRKNDFYIWG